MTSSQWTNWPAHSLEQLEAAKDTRLDVTSTVG